MPRDEHQTRIELINPALYNRGWGDSLIREEKTPGGTDIIDGRPRKRKGRTDYLLCVLIVKGKPPMPLAILEAKAEDKLPSLGIQQAKDYMKKFNVPFVFSTNGKLFTEYGKDTGQIKDALSLSDFPTPEELKQRYEKINGFKLESEGTGKTVIAVQLLHKLGLAGQLKRALFVCDRDELRTQGMGKLHSVFGDNAQIVTAEDDEPRFWKENYPKNYFSHIILDECHRSAWGKWSVILMDNPDAVHIGLTATPRIVVGGKKGSDGRNGDESITAHNIEYFGDPIYEYSIGDGQEDGYLAACEVIRRTVDLDKKEITKEDIERRSAFDPYTGKKINPKDIEDQYNAKDYEVKLMLDDRVKAMSEDLFQLLLDTGGPHQKTIIFCARDSHANQIMIAMNNLYEKWCKVNRQMVREWYAFQCTGNPDLRPPADKIIPDFRGSKNSHFIAATVDLLSTGVDIPNLGNVVFFRYLESPISFYQMVGRGTRTGEPRGSKLMFRLYDYTNATRLFGEEFKSRAKPSKPEEPPGGVESPSSTYGDDMPKRRIIRVREQQFTVQIEGEGRSILCEENGKEVLVPLEEYKQILAQRLVDEAPDINELREKWTKLEKRLKLISHLGGDGAVRLIRELDDERECDLFDVLAKLGYGIPTKSRMERTAAFKYKNKQWLRQFPEITGNVLVSIARQFEKGGIEELETTEIFNEAEVVASGGFQALVGLKIAPEMLIQETKTRLLT